MIVARGTRESLLDPDALDGREGVYRGVVVDVDGGRDGGHELDDGFNSGCNVRKGVPVNVSQMVGNSATGHPYATVNADNDAHLHIDSEVYAL